MSKQAKYTDALDRLLMRLQDHDDDADAIVAVDRLMREYATTAEPLTADAQEFGADLRTVARAWATPAKGVGR